MGIVLIKRGKVVWSESFPGGWHGCGVLGRDWLLEFGILCPRWKESWGFDGRRDGGFDGRLPFRRVVDLDRTSVVMMHEQIRQRGHDKSDQRQ